MCQKSNTIEHVGFYLVGKVFRTLLLLSFSLGFNHVNTTFYVVYANERNCRQNETKIERRWCVVSWKLCRLLLFELSDEVIQFWERKNVHQFVLYVQLMSIATCSTFFILAWTFYDLTSASDIYVRCTDVHLRVRLFLFIQYSCFHSAWKTIQLQSCFFFWTYVDGIDFHLM